MSDMISQNKNGDVVKNNMWVVMQQRELTVKKLERLSGISDSQIVRIADGISDPTITTAYKLANALGITIEALFPNPKSH